MSEEEFNSCEVGSYRRQDGLCIPCPKSCPAFKLLDSTQQKSCQDICTTISSTTLTSTLQSSSSTATISVQNSTCQPTVIYNTFMQYNGYGLSWVVFTTILFLALLVILCFVMTYIFKNYIKPYQSWKIKVYEHHIYKVLHLSQKNLELNLKNVLQRLQIDLISDNEKQIMGFYNSLKRNLVEVNGDDFNDLEVNMLNYPTLIESIQKLRAKFIEIGEILKDSDSEIFDSFKKSIQDSFKESIYDYSTFVNNENSVKESVMALNKSIQTAINKQKEKDLKAIYLQEINVANEEKNNDLNITHQKEILNLKATNEKRINDLNIIHQKEILDLKATNEKRINDLNVIHQKEIADLKTSYEENIDENFKDAKVEQINDTTNNVEQLKDTQKNVVHVAEPENNILVTPRKDQE